MTYDGARRAETGVTGRDAMLAQRLVTLADSLADDYDLASSADRLVTTAVQLPGVSQATLLLRGPEGRPQVAAATSDAARVLELLALQGADGGPGSVCVDTGEPAQAPDLMSPGQAWPGYAVAASKAGYRSVYAVPLRLREEVVGGLVLHCTGAGGLSHTEELVARALADAATVGMLQQRSLHQAAARAAQLQAALDSRIVIEQAKGVLAEHGGVDMDTAFAALRAFSRNANLKVGDVAASLVSRSRAPVTVLGAVPRQRR